MAEKTNPASGYTTNANLNPLSGTNSTERKISNLKNSIPNDEIEDMANGNGAKKGFKKGRKEYNAMKRLANRAVSGNSLDEVEESINKFEIVGWLGKIVSLGIGILMVGYELKRLIHLDQLIWDWAYWSTSIILALLIMWLIHDPLKSMVNSSWSKRNKTILFLMLSLGIGGKAYLDTKGIEFYISSVQVSNATKDMNNTSTVTGSKMATQNVIEENINSKINSYRRSLKAENDRLVSINSEIQSANSVITKYNASGSTAKKKPKRVTTAYYAQKRLRFEKIEVQANIKTYNDSIDWELKKLQKMGNEKASIISNALVSSGGATATMKYSLIILLVLIEVMSIADVIGRHLANNTIDGEILRRLVMDKKAEATSDIVMQHIDNNAEQRSIRLGNQVDLHHLTNQKATNRALESTLLSTANLDVTLGIAQQVNESVQEVSHQALSGAMHEIELVQANDKLRRFQALVDKGFLPKLEEGA